MSIYNIKNYRIQCEHTFQGTYLYTYIIRLMSIGMLYKYVRQYTVPMYIGVLAHNLSFWYKQKTTNVLNGNQMLNESDPSGPEVHAKSIP